MELRISATELARKLSDVLGRIRSRGDSFVIERNGEALARIGPVSSNGAGTVGEGLRAWVEAADEDSALADDLEQIGRDDSPSENPWA